MRLASLSDLQRPREEIADLIDRASQISQLYDDMVESERGDGHLRAPGIHASELSCERQMFYSVIAQPKKNSVNKNMRQRFQLGKAVHSMLQADFHMLARNSGGRIQFEDEVPVSPKHQEIARRLNIHSSCDGIFSFLEEPYVGPIFLRLGLEIKTEAPDSYEKVVKDGPKEEHIDQAHVYMRCLDFPLMYFMYVNKGNQNNVPSISPFLIEFDPVRWARIEEKCKRVLSMVQREEVPERQESFRCTFCPYNYVCEPETAKPKPTMIQRWKNRRQ